MEINKNIIEQNANNDNNLNTLIRLQKLQTLLKKESALKELCNLHI